MQRNDFLESVSAQGDLESVDVAEDVTIATLRALGERLTPGEAEDLASALPDELAGVLGEVKGDGAEQFLERVRNREAETDRVDAANAEGPCPGSDGDAPKGCTGGGGGYSESASRRLRGAL
jgi:uncharacterized protein (DUF2267 family)